MSKKLVIGCDYDGVIGRLTGAAVPILNDRHGLHLDAERDCTEWDWYLKCNVSKDEFWSAIDDAHRGNMANVDFYDGETHGALTRLYLKHELFILTGKHKRHHESLRGWLDAKGLWFLGVYEHPEKKWMGWEDKLNVEWDLLIEDAPHAAEWFIDNAGASREEKGVLILHKAPWNRTIREHLDGIPDVFVSGSWRETEAIINKIAEGLL